MCRSPRHPIQGLVFIIYYAIHNKHSKINTKLLLLKHVRFVTSRLRPFRRISDIAAACAYARHKLCGLEYAPRTSPPNVGSISQFSGRKSPPSMQELRTEHARVPQRTLPHVKSSRPDRFSPVSPYGADRLQTKYNRCTIMEMWRYTHQRQMGADSSSLQRRP